jgi:L-threonylcarbamoyladenylate synthase
MRTQSRTTTKYAVDAASPEAAAIAAAAQAIQGGLLVAFPTETVYGLGADALNPDAVAGIFAAKGRPADNPLIVHIADMAQLETVTSYVSPLARVLAEAFWPGPLTLVLPRHERVPAITSAGLDTVAVRMPAHPIALALVRAAGCPIAAPSANRSGQPSPTRAKHVAHDLWGSVAVLLDGGACDVGVESTVLDVTVVPPVVLRPGGLPMEAIVAVIGEVRGSAVEADAARRSPGTRYRHYAPRAKVVLAAPNGIAAEAQRWADTGHRVGVMSVTPIMQGDSIRWRPMSADTAQYAQHLFAALRELDDGRCTVIVAETVDEQGIGSAVMDRLRRAAAAEEMPRD